MIEASESGGPRARNPDRDVTSDQEGAGKELQEKRRRRQRERERGCEADGQTERARKRRSGAAGARERDGVRGQECDNRRRMRQSTDKKAADSLALFLSLSLPLSVRRSR